MATTTRRNILRGTAALGLLPLAAPGGARAAGPLEDTLLIRTTGGVFEAALKRNFFDPFTKESGVRVVPFAASYGDMMAKSAAMQAAGRVEWDIISPQYDELTQISRFLEDLGDCSAMPNVAKLGVPNACGRYGVLYLTGGQPLTWNTSIIKGPRKPQSWADFFDTKAFPGRRALPNSGSPWATLVMALLADGVPREKLFPLDLDRAFGKLDTIKDDVAVWWKTGDQSVKMWDGDEIAMSLMFGGTAYAAKRSGVPIDYTYNQAVADFGAWAILKGAPHPNAARAFIDFFMTNPENHARFAHEMGYTTSNAAAGALLDPADKSDLLATPESLAAVIRTDYVWLNEHRAAVINRFQAWVSA